jgi:Putative adhesin
MIRRLSCLVAVVALAACDVSIGNLAGRATDEWSKTYQLAPGGELQIGNTNGRIDIEGVDGNTVDVRAERIAKATTDEAARELLPRIKITDEAQPDHITIETAKIGGIMLGAGVEVRYHVRAPKNAVVNVTNTNGLISLKGLSGKIRARTTNGGVRGNELTGAVEASATNGGVNIDLASVGREPITLSTTNGGVSIDLPEDAKADVVATCTNGGISVSGVKMEMTEQSRRRLEGKLNGGGAAIELKTTNGGIRIRGRSERG